MWLSVALQSFKKHRKTDSLENHFFKKNERTKLQGEMQGEPAWWRGELSDKAYADFKDDITPLTQPQMCIPSRPSRPDRTDLKLALPHHLWPTYSFSSHLNDSLIPHLADPNLSTLPSFHRGNNLNTRDIRKLSPWFLLSLKSLSTLCDRQPDDNIALIKAEHPPKSWALSMGPTSTLFFHGSLSDRDGHF